MMSHPVRVATFVSTTLLCLALVIAAISSGCGEPPPLDTSLLTSEPCEPPCWQGLTPGVSTLQEVNEFVRTSGFVNPQTLFRSGVYRGGERVGLSIEWGSAAGRGRGYNDFIVESGVLKYIIIYPDYDLSLERLFERYGPPEKYVANLRGVERRWVEVTLYYPTHGFTVELVRRYDDTTLTLKPESRVASVWYFRAAPLERFLELGCEAGIYGGTPDDWLESLRDWPGYGPIPLD